jgi:DNA-binding transcriptional MerR regulator
MRIGKAADHAGVRVDTIRYYERVGLLPRPPRTPAGYREYTDAGVRRITLVRAALRFGFSTRQVANFLQSRDKGRPPCRDVRAAGDRLLQGIEDRIAELRTARDEIRRTLQAWDERLAATESGAAGHLLEMLSGRNPATPHPRHRA